MANVIAITAEQFQHEVRESKLPVLVDFYASWCGPCRMLAPLLEALAVEFRGRVKFVKVDVEKEFALADEYGIRSVPTVIVFNNGIVVDGIVGLAGPQALHEKLARVAPAPAAVTV